MKKLNELNWKETKEFAALLHAWLDQYTAEVVKTVYPKLEEIYNNEFVMNLLRELKTRQEKEAHADESDFLFMVRNACEGEEFDKFGFSNHCLEHSKSYRDVLYDMFIKS